MHRPLLTLFGLILAAFLLADLATAQNQTTALQLGVPVERTLARGQSQSFTISLEQDQFLQLVVEQRGIDVVVKVVSPTGKMLGEFDSPNGNEGPENVSLISATAGTYRIDVAPLAESEDTAAGRFEIRVLELRAATAQELQTGKNQESLKAKGTALLVEIAGAVEQIRLPQTRVRAQMQAAQLLWNSDEKLANKLVAAAIEGVKEYLTQAANDEQDYYQTYAQATALRYEVVQVLGSRDPELALAFLRSTNTLTNPDPGQNLNQSNQELQFEVMLANQILARDPKRALQIAEDTLKRGYSYSLLDIINKLRTTDAEAAARLAKQVAVKLQGEKLLKNQEATNLALNLLQIAHSSGRRGRTPPAKPEVALLSEQDYRDLFEKTLGEGLSYSPPALNSYSPEREAARNILNTLKSMAPETVGSSSAGSAAIEKKLSEFQSPIDSQSARWQKYRVTINSGSLDAGLEAAAQAPPELKDQLYHQLAQKATNAGDFETARQILKDHIHKPSQLQQALSNLDQHAIQIEASRGKIEEALRIVTTLRTARERATILAQIVNQIGPGQKRAAAISLLEQARAMVAPSARTEGPEQMNALLEIARAFSRYDSKRAFEILEPILDQLNEMSAAAQVLDGFGQQYYEDGELVLLNGSSVANAATQLTAALGTLALANFDRAKAGAERISRPEVRINAYLAIAQQAISPTEGRMAASW
ncbi:MAG TPA: hypothetical protein VMS31_02460 [Pyrinomonadaceae bacterium]|nr:hypothetical protein [Pyrinomonadaceae bacterium]